MSSSKKRNNKKPSSFTVNWLGKVRQFFSSLPKRFIVGLTFSVVFGVISMYFSTNHELRPEGLLGFGVFHNCSIDPEVSLGISPRGNKDADITILITNWADIQETCNLIRINIPGASQLPRYVANMNSLLPPTSNPQENENPPSTAGQTPEISEAELITVGFEIEPTHIRNYKGLGGDIWELYPHEYKGFAGGFKFSWENAFSKLNYYSIGFILPLVSFSEAGSELNSIQDYAIEITSPDGYLFSNSNPSTSSYHQSAEREWLIFEIKNKQNDILIWYEDIDKKSASEKYQFFLAALLGAGIALLAEEIIQFLVKKKQD